VSREKNVVSCHRSFELCFAAPWWQRFQQDHVGPNRLILVLAGHVACADANETLQSASRGWNPSVLTQRDPRATQSISGDKFQAIDIDGAPNLTMLYGTQVGPFQKDADEGAFQIANAALGAGPTSRLFKQLRQTAGLSYAVRSELHSITRKTEGAWVIRAFTDRKRAPHVLALIQAVLKDLSERGLSDVELRDYQSELSGRHVIASSTTMGLARYILQTKLRGGSWPPAEDYRRRVNQVNASHMNAVLRQYADPTRWHIVIAGEDASKLQFREGPD